MTTQMIKHCLSSAILIAVLMTSGCAVIHFENGPAVPPPGDTGGFSFGFGLFDDEEELAQQSQMVEALRLRKWYHHGIFSIAEISNPLEIGQACIGQEWNQVTTEVTPLDALLGLADNALLLHANSAGLDLWSPWSIEYSCRDR